MMAQRTFSSIGQGKSVGFVGLGCMGIPMSQNLKKAGFEVKGYDIMPNARK
jgi:3-hydroxyisobutyrate dehydrogenase-like beta-hydroxyacid dehydrogenase